MCHRCNLHLISWSSTGQGNLGQTQPSGHHQPGQILEKQWKTSHVVLQRELCGPAHAETPLPGCCQKEKAMHPYYEIINGSKYEYTYMNSLANHVTARTQGYAHGSESVQIWPYQKRPNWIWELLSLASRSTLNKSQSVALKATETLHRCSKDLAQTLQMVRLKNCQIQTGTHKPRLFMLHLASGQSQSQHNRKIPLSSQRSLQVPIQSQHELWAVCHILLLDYLLRIKWIPVVPHTIAYKYHKLLLVSARMIQAFWNETCKNHFCQCFPGRKNHERPTEEMWLWKRARLENMEFHKHQF